jgi:hypothetical protein
MPILGVGRCGIGVAIHSHDEVASPSPDGKGEAQAMETRALRDYPLLVSPSVFEFQH